jgi:hypothetical protein
MYAAAVHAANLPLIMTLVALAFAYKKALPHAHKYFTSTFFIST